MSEDILQKIVRKRSEDIERLGLNFGIEIPASRRRGHVEFLGTPGAILEVKRASPSKGDIAPDLNPVGLATTYAEAHAQAISVLTEMNYFKGSLRDLIAVADAMEERAKQGLHACAVLCRNGQHRVRGTHRHQCQVLRTGRISLQRQAAQERAREHGICDALTRI